MKNQIKTTRDKQTQNCEEKFVPDKQLKRTKDMKTVDKPKKK